MRRRQLDGKAPPASAGDALGATGHAVVVVRSDGRGHAVVEYANSAFCAVVGADVEPGSPAGLYGLDPAGDCGLPVSAAGNGESAAGRIPVRAAGGHREWLDASAGPFAGGRFVVVGRRARTGGPAGTVPGGAGADPLTGLPNRAVLMERLDEVLRVGARQPSGTAAAVLFVSLDWFKVVNETVGPAAGDEVLRESADRLRDVVREDDLVARFGGDDFVVLCERVPAESAEKVAVRFVEAFREPFLCNGYGYLVTVSVGVSAGDGTSAELLVREASAAMQEAKRDGKNRCKVFSASMGSAEESKASLQRDLRHAVDRAELDVAYQPICDLSSGRVVGAEALVRWRHPLHGTVMPNTFVPIAEATGMIVPIGGWVLEQAVERAAEWNSRYPLLGSLCMSVNLSARQLSETRFADDVDGLLRRFGVGPALLTLEITESLLMDEEALASVAEIREFGVGLAIDDFGTGYSSLAYLRDLPADVLKIDRRLVDKVGTVAQARAVVGTITQIGRDLGMQVLAEGVETDVQVRELRGMGCDLAQGYIFGAPVPAESFERSFLAGGGVLTSPGRPGG